MTLRVNELVLLTTLSIIQKPLYYKTKEGQNVADKKDEESYK